MKLRTLKGLGASKSPKGTRSRKRFSLRRSKQHGDDASTVVGPSWDKLALIAERRDDEAAAEAEAEAEALPRAAEDAARDAPDAGAEVRARRRRATRTPQSPRRGRPMRNPTRGLAEGLTRI